MPEKINLKEVDVVTINEIHTIYNLLIELDEIIKDDRRRGVELYDMAKENYEEIKKKQEDDELVSDDAALERELNLAVQQMTEAYKALISSSEKVPRVMDVISRMHVTKYKADVLLRIAGRDERQIDLSDPDDKLKLLRERKKLQQANAFLEQNDDKI